MIYAWIERDDGADRDEFHRVLAMAKRSLNDLRDEMRAVARGERAPSPLPAGELLNVLASAEHRALLQVIHLERPETVSRLAELTGRAQPNISRALQQLAKHGLITLVRDGREVRPVPRATKVSISLIDDTYEMAAEASAVV
jgi:predicted transcriptional regulator